MSTDIGRYSRSIISTRKFDRVIQVVRGLELSHWMDDIGPVSGQIDRRIMIDLRRLRDQIQFDPDACEEFRNAPTRLLESVIPLILHASNVSLDLSECEILLIEEDKSDPS